MFKLFNRKSAPKAKVALPSAAPVAVSEKKLAKAEPVGLGASRAHRILLKPLVSEKTAHLGAFDIYGFVVNLKANKVEIAKAFQVMYNVKPLAIRVAIVPEKRKRTGRTWGVRAAWKKALIRVPKGSKVDIFTGV